MISSTLIKSDNKSMIEVVQIDIYVRGLEKKSIESKITQFEFDFAEKSKIEQR